MVAVAADVYFAILPPISALRALNSGFAGL